MPAAGSILLVAVPSPLRRIFDYLPPDEAPFPRPGARVRVFFGRRETVGVVVGIADHSSVSPQRLKQVRKALDVEPAISESLLSLLIWAADYYHHPIGEVIQTALPVALRRGAAVRVAGEPAWRLTAAGERIVPAALARAPLQRKIHMALGQAPGGLTSAALQAVSARWRSAMRALQAKGWVERTERDCLTVPEAVDPVRPVLNGEQREAVTAISESLGRYACHVLHGITGSGKTEVYLHAIERVIARGDQALVLVPEIGLTPQLVARFRARFAQPVAVLHSGLNDSERLCAWQMARIGKAAVVIGTRSAVFCPFARLGLIVVDEEHDASFKQQDGFRYHARDVAVMRASRAQLPVVLGSATPSLETVYNVRQGRYRMLELPERTGAGSLPAIRVVDLRKQKIHDGLSPALVVALRERLVRGEQSLLFLNRRGFAPVCMCHDCGWLAPCHRCDARLTLHRDVRVSQEAGSRERPLHPRSQRLRCHHCGAEEPSPATCPACGSASLHGVGEGTERVEEALGRLFPEARIERIDRDSTRRKGALEAAFRRIHAGDADILVGTQMLAKGHDFPNLTLVGVLNADQGLYSVDFRSEEVLFQQLLQVSGRAGRAGRPGEVLLQTHHPEHPVFAALMQHDYAGFGDYLLAERRAAGYPPYAYFALLRAESPQAQMALTFLKRAREIALASGAVAEATAERAQVMEPLPSPMERRAGRYRAQLLVQAAARSVLYDLLRPLVERLDEEPLGRKVRWSLDVDPVDLY